MIKGYVFVRSINLGLCLLLTGLCFPVVAQTKLDLNVALVLTPDFCGTVSKKGTWGINQEKFKIGKAACEELEPAIQGAFHQVQRVEAPPPSSNNQLVLLPRFVDASANQTLGAFSNRELVVLVEWTVRDQTGKTVWVETVQGSAKHHMGNTFTYQKNLKKIVTESVQDMANQSAAKMLAAPELRKLAM